MNKISLPKLPTVNRKIVYITAGIIVLLAVLGYAMVAQVQQKKTDDHKAAVAAEQQKAKDTATQKQIASLEASLAVSEQKRTALCSYISGLTQAKATRTLVTVPAIPCTK